MKLKGINPFEQHVEQIVLVAVSGIFLVVLAAQFLIEPNRVKVGNSPAVPPGKAFVEAESRADVLKGKLTASGTPEGVTIPEVRLAEDFRRRLAEPVVAEPRLEGPLGPRMALQEIAGDKAILVDKPLAVVTLPAPTSPTPRAFRNTIDPTEPLNNPALAALLPKQQPMDKAAVSVEAAFDGQALRQALGASAGDARAIPANWWENRTAILGVRLEREELTGEDTWTGTTEIPPAPGRLDGLARAKALTGAQDMEDLVAEVRAAEDEVLRAPYYHTIAGPEWAEPSAQPAAAAGAPREVAQHVKTLRQSRNQKEALTKQLEDLDRAPSRAPAPSTGGGGGKGSAGGGSGGGAGAPARDPNENRRKQLQGQIENIQKRIDIEVAKLKDLGYDEEGVALKKDAPPPVDPNQPQNKARSVLDQSSVRLWAHDLTAEPGKTYRYRVKLAINNPAFGRGAALVKQQQELAAQPALWSEPSEWSTPVTVPADRYYFITSASEANALAMNPPRASAEMYQFFYGYYRKGVVSMEPGDPMMTPVKLPPGEKLPIYDLTKPLADASNPSVPAPPAAQPEQPVPAGRGGKGGAMGGGGGAVAPAQGGAPAQQQQPKVTLPPNASKWDTPIIASEDVFLLDVERVPTADGPRLLAVLRDTDGRLITRSPDEVGEVYKLVAASAKEGENQGQAALPEPEKAKPQAPVAPVPRGPATAPPPPGGGGSGGG